MIIMVAKQSETKYSLNSSAELRIKDDGGIIYLDRKTFIINGVGVLILKGIESKKTKNEIIKMIITEYDVTEYMASDGFDEFIDKLKHYGLLLESGHF